jgi:hypothetical protein
MNTKEVAAHYEAKVFDSPEAASSAGFVLTETLTTRNTWNKASAAQAVIHKLLLKKRQGETDQIGIVIEPQSITGCYKKDEGGTQKAE